MDKDIIENLQRQIEVLRDDFQQLEQVMHTQRESFEAESEVLKETIKNMV